MVRVCLELPEELAKALDTRAIIAIDEFQEFAGLSGKRGLPDPLPLMRSLWQRHELCAYLVSGSGRSMLEEMVASKHSPFFQHFDLMYLEPFPTEEAIRFLVTFAPPGRKIPPETAQRAVAAVGGHPYYLQLVGRGLTDREPPYDDACLKEVIGELLFSQSGRLALYFQREHYRLVGRSAYLAATLGALVSRPQRLTDVATAISTRVGDAARYLERLGDAVTRRDDGLYQIADPTFALWLTWRAPGGAAVPMTVLGDEAERRVAEELARMGFELVYQSRASRGAFDLLGIRGHNQVGVQVRRRAALPLRFKKSEWNRMQADADRFGWSWLIATVSSDLEVAFLDPKKARRQRENRLDESGRIESVLKWLDHR